MGRFYPKGMNMNVTDNDTKMDCFVYYGVIMGSAAVSELVRLHGYQSVYEFVHSKGLNYRPVGFSAYRNRLVIGREIHWDFATNVTEFAYDEDTDRITFRSRLIDDGKIVNVDNAVEFDYTDIDERLTLLGIREKPRFYIVTCNAHE